MPVAVNSRSESVMGDVMSSCFRCRCCVFHTGCECAPGFANSPRSSLTWDPRQFQHQQLQLLQPQPFLPPLRLQRKRWQWRATPKRPDVAGWGGCYRLEKQKQGEREVSDPKPAPQAKTSKDSQQPRSFPLMLNGHLVVGCFLPTAWTLSSAHLVSLVSPGQVRHHHHHHHHHRIIVES